MYYVYFIREKDIQCPNVKIGYSKDYSKRLKTLQTGHPKSLGIFGLIRCDTEDTAKKLEKHFHTIYKKNKLVGEWFRWHQDFDDLIKNNNSIISKYDGYIRYFS
jgi:hypothetical protein